MPHAFFVDISFSWNFFLLRCFVNLSQEKRILLFYDFLTSWFTAIDALNTIMALFEYDFRTVSHFNLLYSPPHFQIPKIHLKDNINNKKLLTFSPKRKAKLLIKAIIMEIVILCRCNSITRVASSKAIKFAFMLVWLKRLKLNIFFKNTFNVYSKVLSKFKNLIPCTWY